MSPESCSREIGRAALLQRAVTQNTLAQGCGQCLVDAQRNVQCQQPCWATVTNPIFAVQQVRSLDIHHTWACRRHLTTFESLKTEHVHAHAAGKLQGGITTAFVAVNTCILASLATPVPWAPLVNFLGGLVQGGGNRKIQIFKYAARLHLTLTPCSTAAALEDGCDLNCRAAKDHRVMTCIMHDGTASRQRKPSVHG